jgi:hypothetical protein
VIWRLSIHTHHHHTCARRYEKQDPDLSKLPEQAVVLAHIEVPTAAGGPHLRAGDDDSPTHKDAGALGKAWVSVLPCVCVCV